MAEHVFVDGEGREAGLVICMTCHRTLFPEDVERHAEFGPAAPPPVVEVVPADRRESSIVWEASETGPEATKTAQKAGGGVSG